MKVGDRVRINCPTSPRHGMEGVIWEILESHSWRPQDAWRDGETGYRVDIDGLGKWHLSENFWFCYLRHELIPILGSWETITAMLGKDIRKSVKEKV